MAERYRVVRWNEVFPPHMAMLRLTLEQEGYRVLHWCDRPGTFYGEHQHPEDQTHWVVSGVLEVSLRFGLTFQLAAGDRDFMPANTVHSARVIGDEPVMYFVGEKLPAKKKRGRPKKKKKELVSDEFDKFFTAVDRLAKAKEDPTAES